MCSDVLIKSYITAVEIIPHFVLVGVGNILQVHDINKKEVSTYLVFQKQRIHGIRINESRNELVCFGNREIAVAHVGLDEFHLIFQSRLVVGDWIWDIRWKNEEMIVLCANNTLSLWNWKQELNLKKVINRVKCLLYSGIIIGNEWVESIVIAGTMFKSILIWAPSFGTDESCPVLHRLTGHTGAIFSIFYHEKLERLCSTSDDRSVRIWSICPRAHSGTIVEKWRQASISLLITVYGHMSRVWKSIVLNDGGFLTAGEDGQLRLWDEKGKPIYSWITHQGASIRSMSVDQAANMIVTGGGDGGISLWPLPKVDNAHTAEKVEQIRFNDILGLTKLQDVPRRIVLSRSGKLFTVTNHGHLLCYDGSLWQCVVKDNRFADYCLLQISKSRQYISLSSIRGDVMILRESGRLMKVVCHENLCGSKIFSFHWLDDYNFLICCEQGRMEIWTLKNDDAIGLAKAQRTRTLILPLCREWWSTSALQTHDTVLIGDRDGSLHAYSDHIELHPIQTFKRIHGRLGVSYIGNDEENDRILSVGRDGYVRYWHIREGNLFYLTACRLPIKWPVQVMRTNTYGTLVVGFNEVNFEVWHVEERKKLLTFTCGGGHRPWDFILSDHIGFVFIKKDVVYKLTLSTNRLKVISLSEGFHVRETECLRCLKENLFISGGEDTTLRVFRLEAQRELKTITIARSHVSSIKAISYVYIKDSALVVSVGGRAQLNVYKINTEPTITYEELASHSMKSSNKCKKSVKNVLSPLDLEPRYMDVHLYVENDTVFIYCAGSDSVWRVFTFNTNTKFLRVLKEVEYANFCVLKIARMNWLDRDIVVTFTSNGMATFWNARTYIMIFQKVLHQSGINSYDYVISNDSQLLLATGGDDASIKFSIYENEHDEIVQINCVSGFLHEANITGLKIISNYIISASCDQKILLWQWKINDCKLQRLELIRVYHSLIPDIRGLEVIHTDDTQALICVYGVGFQTLTVQLG